MAREAGKARWYCVIGPVGEPVAQLVEHVTFNHGVRGSSPRGLTIHINELHSFSAIIFMADKRNQGNRNQNDSRRGPLIALGVVMLLFLIGWLLAHELYANGKLEDCLMSGRTNCVPIETPSR